MALTPKKLSYSPRLVPGEYLETSDETEDYNCIAWAAGETHTCWWPTRGYYWPPEAPFEETIPAFVEAFRLLGYGTCVSPELEPGYEKVAIYATSNGTPTHAAVQKETGLWSSKLGDWEDIEHTLVGVEGPSYGAVTVYLRRRRTRTALG